MHLSLLHACMYIYFVILLLKAFVSYTCWHIGCICILGYFEEEGVVFALAFASALASGQTDSIIFSNHLGGGARTGRDGKGREKERIKRRFLTRPDQTTSHCRNFELVSDLSRGRLLVPRFDMHGSSSCNGPFVMLLHLPQGPPSFPPPGIKVKSKSKS